jgi:hypothetical protein
MTLPLTWDQMPLTPAEQQIMQNLIVWNQSQQGPPPSNYGEVKAAREWTVSCNSLVMSAQAAIATAMLYYQNEHMKQLEDANPPTPPS